MHACAPRTWQLCFREKSCDHGGGMRGGTSLLVGRSLCAREKFVYLSFPPRAPLSHKRTPLADSLGEKLRFFTTEVFVTGGREGQEGGAGGMRDREDAPSSFLVCDAPLPGGQHVVEGISADACPGEEANQRTAVK